MKKNIPNFITLLNLLFGCCAVVAVLHQQFLLAFWLFLSAVLADYLDGLVARLLKVHSPLGKELDSLADMVSFGFFPGAIFYVLLVTGWTGGPEHDGIFWPAVPGFLLTLFSAFRLAKFNLDTRQSDNFIGLPTPSACTFTVGLLLIYLMDSFGLGALIVQPLFLYPVIALFSYLLVAELPMFSFKFKSLAWQGNEIQFLFAATAVILLVLLREAALSTIILLYLLVSVLIHFRNQRT